MDIAIAMKYGGEPIKAEECNETSYLTMGLLCPCENCKDVVRWVPPQERVSTRGREYPVKAHFAHFKAKDPTLQAQCEKRVNNLKKTDIEKMVRRAVQQRSSLFQRWLWEVLNAHIIRCDLTSDFNMNDYLFFTGEFSEYTPGKEFSKTIAEYNEKYRVLAQEGAESFLNIMKIHKELQRLTNSIHPNNEQEVGEDNPMSDFTKQMHGLATSRLHRQIVKESLDFLGAKRNFAIRNALFIWLFTVGNEHIQNYFELNLNSDELGKKLYPIIGKLFAVIPWADEFNDLSQGKPLVRVSLTGAVLMHILNEVEATEFEETEAELKKPVICL